MSIQPVELRQSILFGEDFALDLRPRRLRRGDRVLKLERIPLEILLLLLDRPGEIVTRDEIISRIWGNDVLDRKSTRLNSSHQIISYAVFCLKKKTKKRY